MTVRMRRLRANAAVRRMFQETSLSPAQLIQPYFVVGGRGVRREVRTGLGLWQLSPDVLREEVASLARAGVGGVMLFGVPESDQKRDDGAQLASQMEMLRQAIAEVKSAVPELPVFADVCLCAYTTHGHCGLVKDGRVLNDESVEVLARQAVLLGQWGADFVCPSDMMDGRVRTLRERLDASKLEGVGILSYAVKMASAFYGPFREAAHSSPSFGDRKTYQMPATNRREALRELAFDEAEGADALLIKPAMTNLDLIRDAREATALPLFAYQVSGEFAMLRAAADQGLLDFDRAIDEALLSIRRAGADVIVSYQTRSICLSA